MTEKEMQIWLKTNLNLTSDKPLTSGIIFHLRKSPNIKTELQHLTKNTSESESELLYCFFHPEVRPVCQYCGKPVPFISYTLGYKKACCKECANKLTSLNGQNTKADRYGDRHFNNPTKAAKTKLKKYGVAGFNNQLKIQETKTARYNNPNFNNPEKNRQTCQDRYGVSNGAKLLETKLKQQETCQKRYQASSPMKSELIKQRYIRNSQQIRGYSWPLADPDFRKQHKITGQTSNEKKIEAFLQNRGFEYKAEYVCNGKCFDFAVFKDGQLSILIETDGEYYHGLLGDYDGVNVRGETDRERFSKVPEGVKYLVADSKNTQALLKEITEVFDIDYQAWIDQVLSSLPAEFPYYSYSEKRLRDDWEHLCTYPYNRNQYLGSSLVRHFHKSVMTAHVKNYPSPLQAWQDKALLRKCVENRMIYGNKLSSQAIADGFSICKLAPQVSLFNPSRARYLVQKYLNDFNEIFDPFSGFSGRMLGVCSLGKSYIGQDINADHIRESQEIKNFLQLDAALACRDILESEGEYKCLFTCPPYGGKEHWNTPDDLIEKSCDEWIDECLTRFNCQKYLFVVDHTEEHKDNIVETLTKASHFGTRIEYAVLISK